VGRNVSWVRIPRPPPSKLRSQSQLLLKLAFLFPPGNQRVTGQEARCEFDWNPGEHHPDASIL
jgi:hypothetical protein